MKKKETWRKIFRVVAIIVSGIFMAILSIEKFVSAPVEEKILRAIPDGAHIISLCIEGEQFSSEDLSAYINKVTAKGASNIVFVLGSSFGLCEKVKQLSNKKLSFSKMTFPHQLARIMLLEQVYRAFKITEGSDYHK